MHFRFREWEVWYFDWNFTEVCSEGSNWQLYSNDLDDGLVLSRRQAIIWTNAVLIDWRIYAHSGEMSWIIWILLQTCNVTFVQSSAISSFWGFWDFTATKIVNTFIIGPRSLSDKNWEGQTGCACLSMLNYGKNQCRSDKTLILNSLRPNDAYMHQETNHHCCR